MLKHYLKYNFYFCIIVCIGIFSCKTNSTLVKNENKDLLPNQPRKIIENTLKGENSQAETYRTIYISLFDNQSLRGEFTSRLQQKLQILVNTSGKLQLETDSTKAELILDGNITEYEQIPASYNQLYQVTAYIVSLTVDISLFKNVKNGTEILFENRDIRFDTRYYPLDSPYESEFIMQERLLDGIGERILYTTLNGWYNRLKTAAELNKPISDNNVIPTSEINREDLPYEKKKQLKILEQEKKEKPSIFP